MRLQCTVKDKKCYIIVRRLLNLTKSKMSKLCIHFGFAGDPHRRGGKFLVFWTIFQVFQGISGIFGFNNDEELGLA